jgi:hypothetical protein
MLAQWNLSCLLRSLFNRDEIHSIGAKPIYLGYAIHSQVDDVDLRGPLMCYFTY